MRTEIQHEWAELFEKLADLLGRGIRYGEPPAPLLTDAQREQLREMGIDPGLLETSERSETVALAISIAEVVDTLERIEAARSDPRQLSAARASVKDALAELQLLIDDFEQAQSAVLRLLSGA